jgi:hypothetical protein
MSMTTFLIDLGKLKSDLEAMGRQAPIIMARSLNRAATAGKTATVKAVAADTGLQQKYINREIRVDKANRSRPAVTIEIVGKRIPLIAFSARGPEPSRGKGRGVSYRLPTGRGRIAEAFIATVGAGGHRGVFKRRGKRRLPIVELRGPSIPHVFEKYLPTFRVVAEESLLKNLAHEISFAKSATEGVA